MADVLMWGRGDHSLATALTRGRGRRKRKDSKHLVIPFSIEENMGSATVMCLCHWVSDSSLFIRDVSRFRIPRNLH